MKKLLSIGFGLLIGLSLFAGCGGGGSAIQPPPPSATPSSCPSQNGCLSLAGTPPPQTGNVGQWLAFGPSTWVQGGVLPYSVSIKSGTLPAGLTLAANLGQVQGIPTATVVATGITFTVTDSETPPVSVQVPIFLSINPMLPLGALSPGSGPLPDATVGVLYIKTCFHRHCHSAGTPISTTGGGVMPYAWSWVAAAGSSLPPGLSLSEGCGVSGLCNTAFIAGMPTTAGTYNFVVAVTDSQSPPKSVSANYTITVSP